MHMSTQTVSSAPIGELALPVMPESLQRIRNEQAREQPDMGCITEIITRDVAMAAEVLKVVNSPAMGLSRAISSIPNAVLILGLPQVLNLSTGVVLRGQMQRCGNGDLGEFWERAADVASATATLAKRLTGVPADMAYTLGLFHDCGVPVLACRYPDSYHQVLREGHRSADRAAIDAESRQFGMNHAMVGYHVGCSWNLPSVVSAAILHHHRFRKLRDDPRVGAEVTTLVALLRLGERLCEQVRGMAFSTTVSGDWEGLEQEMVAFLGVDGTEYDDLKDEVIDQLSCR